MKRLPTKLKCTVCALAVTLIGCSQQSVYEGIRANRFNECVELNPHAFDECERQFGMSYEEYRAKQ